MWDDPFLQHHEIATRRYELSSHKFTWISVRDQMTRATILVDRLISRGIIPRRNGRLLIIGGGVTGVSAALHAVERKVAVTLMEHQSNLFGVFAACHTRRIDPHLYRWPAVGWDDLNWNLDTPLCSTVKGHPIKEYIPVKLVTEWTNKVTYFERKYGANLQILRKAKLLALTWGRDGLPHVEYEHSGTNSQQTFHAVLYAVGLGEEQTYLDNKQAVFKGPEFWANDSFQFDQPDLGLRTRPTVLISGSGDGALQDYIRLLTGKHPAELIRILERALKSENEWHEAKLAILSAQDDAERQLVLSIRPPDADVHSIYIKYEDKINKALHQNIKAQVDRLYAGLTTVTAKIDAVLKKLSVVRPFLDTLHLAISGDEFTWSYPLNRFLVLLLSRYMMEEKRIQTVFPLTKFKLIMPQHSPHRITYDGPASDLYDEYDVVLLRFGIIPPKCLYETDQPTMRRIRMPHPPLVNLL